MSLEDGRASGIERRLDSLDRRVQALEQNDRATAERNAELRQVASHLAQDFHDFNLAQDFHDFKEYVSRAMATLVGDLRKLSEGVVFKAPPAPPDKGYFAQFLEGPNGRVFITGLVLVLLVAMLLLSGRPLGELLDLFNSHAHPG